ncbi:hypothetical protein CAPTEDRAFT_225697 [Capitella teleta]|uniref:Uncharacterized protein n=1 Tax=Capitella teleta TaxID=283909 RepID=R7URW8_CAPTE|nr:hypothetical protein CAPTEDRAFT_225697 [Capitella teleta]|eukprot:ELU08893.1 hypothetical protein CAPTEDRAFT_225697 [Capitella teleta]
MAAGKMEANKRTRRSEVSVGKSVISCDDVAPTPPPLSDDSPAKRLKAELDRELEEDEQKMGFSSPPPTMSLLNSSSSCPSIRKEREEKPAELFRKDLISAMKMADTESLQPEEYFGIQDPWRQEWERGVQVPVHDEELRNEPNANVVEGNEHLLGPYTFKLPHKKYLHACNDETFKQGIHELHDTQSLAEQVCRYDLDDLDVSWLNRANEEFEQMGLPVLAEWSMERVMEELESRCHDNTQEKIKNEAGLGIEYDENIVCDVCKSPESEDGNEMVFCDACDICVHQACYGIQKVPEGSWLCRICALGIKPMCILCPRKGGAMKSTKSGTKWTHVSCALWIPEVSIGVPEKMEPITKISQIPANRWSLICTLCRERVGACIQCCVKTCNVAFHVTCAFGHELDMKTVLVESGSDVQLKAHCPKHSKKKEGPGASPRKTSQSPVPRKESEMTEQQKTEFRSHRLAKLAETFYTLVESKEVAESLKMNATVVDYVWSYWVLKRKSLFNRPLLMPKTEEADILTKQREDSLIARMKMFIHLRQDLERVRNLCYMVSRREKVRRQLYRLKEEVFHKQVHFLTEDDSVLSRNGTREFHAVTEAHKLKASESVYDQYDGLLATARYYDRINGEGSKTPPEPPALKSRGPGRPPKKEVAKVDEVKEVPKVEEVKEDMKEEEKVEVEVIAEPRVTRMRVMSPCPAVTKSPSQGSQSPLSLPRSPHPGSKSPIYGSSAPSLPEQKKSPKVAKNLFDSLCEADNDVRKELRSRVVVTPVAEIDACGTPPRVERSTPLKDDQSPVIPEPIIIAPPLSSKKERKRSALDRIVGNHSLVVSPAIKNKVQRRLSRRKTECDGHMQKKIDRFFRKSDQWSSSRKSWENENRLSLPRTRSGRSTPASESSCAPANSDSEYVPSEGEEVNQRSLRSRTDETSRDSLGSSSSGRSSTRLKSKT